MEDNKKEKKDKNEKEEKDSPLVFKGKYIQAIGRRKTSVAQVRIYPEGKGNIAVNDIKISKYFPHTFHSVATQPLKLTSHSNDLDISVIVKGGGSRGQAEAVRHAITRGLVLLDEELKGTLKAKGWLTRDSRKKERKKPGLKKARKAPQWSKR